MMGWEKCRGGIPNVVGYLFDHSLASPEEMTNFWGENGKKKEKKSECRVKYE